MSKLEKTAIITGASSGMGKALAIHLDQAGYKLLLISTTESKLRQLKNMLKNKHSCLSVDVSDAGEVSKGIHAFFDEFRRIDLVFNSAGYVKRGTLDLESSELIRMLNANFLGVFNVVKAVVPLMKQANAGHIITVSSYSGKFARAPLGGYAASKFAVAGFCESLYKELSNTGISVTTICPNLVDTEMTADVGMSRDKMIKTSDIVKTVDYILALSSSVALKEVILQCKERVVNHERY